MRHAREPGEERDRADRVAGRQRAAAAGSAAAAAAAAAGCEEEGDVSVEIGTGGEASALLSPAGAVDGPATATTSDARVDRKPPPWFDHAPFAWLALRPAVDITVYTLFTLAALFGSPNLYGYLMAICSNTHPHAALQRRTWAVFCAGWTALFFCTATMIHDLRQVVRPADGADDQGGAIARLRRANPLMSVSRVNGLKRWFKGLRLLLVVAVCVMAWTVSVLMSLLGMSHDELLAWAVTEDFQDYHRLLECLGPSDTRFYLAAMTFLGLPMSLFSLFIICAWLLSLQFGGALAADAVDDLCRALGPEASTYSDEMWEEKVRAPAMQLARDTMLNLSCWGPAIGASFIGWWSLAGAFLILATSQSDVKLYAAAVFCSAVPLTLVFAPADVSSSCDGLITQLNERYIEGDKNNAERALRMKKYLSKLNGNQGLGFLIFGTVVDKRYLGRLAAQVSGLLTTVFGLLVTFGQQVAEGGSAAM
jgi:hypothetical protein